MLTPSRKTSYPRAPVAARLKIGAGCVAGAGGDRRVRAIPRLCERVGISGAVENRHAAVDRDRFDVAEFRRELPYGLRGMSKSFARREAVGAGRRARVADKRAQRRVVRAVVAKHTARLKFSEYRYFVGVGQSRLPDDVLDRTVLTTI
jgi:hypothetical protein